MFSSIISVLTGGAAGGIFGILGGIFNRYLDVLHAKTDIERDRLKYAHEVDMREADLKEIQAQAAAQVEIKVQESAAATSAGELSAFQAAYKFDNEKTGMQWVDALRGAVRPILTLVIATCAIFIDLVLLNLLCEHWPEFTNEQKASLMWAALEWIFTQAGIVIGFWFGSRGGSSPFNALAKK